MNLLEQLSIIVKNQLSLRFLLPFILLLPIVAIDAGSIHANCNEFGKIASKADTLDPETEETFQAVEQMPRFPGCEDKGLSYNETKTCAQQKLLEFIFKEITYPKKAKKNNISGMVVVKFVIDVDGSVDDVEIVRDIGKGCGAEAARVVKLMNKRGIKWIPGKHEGENVRVQYNLPVKFALNDKKDSSEPIKEKE